MRRRGFFKRVLGAAGLLIAFPGSGLAKKKKIAVPLKKIPKLATVGGAATLKVKNRYILFIRTSNTEVKAVSALCSHDSCQVFNNAAPKRIDCACHGSSFTTEGKVLGGPAKADLHNYAARLVDDKVVLTLDSP